MTANNTRESKKFQSTLSVRRATLWLKEHYGLSYISIHALRKESDIFPYLGIRNRDISIHALRKESDIMLSPSVALANIFQSTLSVRRATRQHARDTDNIDISIHALRKESDFCQHHSHLAVYISIHALRKESDLSIYFQSFLLSNFNPRSP